MGLMNLFKKKQIKVAVSEKIQEQIDAAVQDALKDAAPSKSDNDFARAKELVSFANSLKRTDSQTTDTSGFFKQLIEFENAKRGIIAIEEQKIDDIMQDIEEAQGSGDESDDLLKTLLDKMGGLKQQTQPQNSPFGAQNPHELQRAIPPDPRAQQVQQQIPQSPAESPIEIKELPDLDPLERAGVAAAVKKIPKLAADAFKGKDEAKKQAIVNAMLDEIENK